MGGETLLKKQKSEAGKPDAVKAPYLSSNYQPQKRIELDSATESRLRQHLQQTMERDDSKDKDTLKTKPRKLK